MNNGHTYIAPTPENELPYPDDHLPNQRPRSLHEMNEEFEELLIGPNRSTGHFARLILAGRYRGDMSESSANDFRYKINVRSGLVGTAHRREDYVITGDWDSAIGMTEDLPFTVAMAIFAVPPFRDTLKKTNHIRGRASVDGDIKMVMLHTIPNYVLGSVQRRHTTRVFLPELWGSRQDRAVPKDILAHSYNVAIRETLREIDPTRLGHLPSTYDLAMTQHQDGRGTMHFSTWDVAPDLLPRFAQGFLQRLRAYPGGRGAYFVHELRGTKAATSHDLSDLEARIQALDDFMSFVDPDSIQSEGSDWYIDVAIELHLPGHVVHPATDGFLDIIQWLLPGLSPTHVRHLHDSDAFYCDQAASLTELAGFRCEPGAKGKRDSVHYMNVYCTEKSAIYQLHGTGTYERASAADLFDPKINRLIDRMDKVASTFASAAGAVDGAEALPGNARFEVRIPIRQAYEKLKTFPDHLFRALFPIPVDVWWMYKHFRLVAIKYVAMHLRLASGEARCMISSLGLGAFIIHQFNALMHRPAMDPSSERMLEALTPHAYENPNSRHLRTSSVWDRYGSMFLNDLVLTDVIWRTPTTRVVPPIDLAYLYHSQTLRAVQRSFVQSNTLLERRPQIGRVRNRIRTAPDVTLFGDYDETVENHNSLLPSFNFHEKGVRMKDRVRPSGPDVDSLVPPQEFEVDTDPYEPNTVDAALQRIIRNFSSNIFTRAPNKKNNQAGSHIIMRRDAALSAGLSIFESFDLSSIFYKVQIRFAKDESVWKNQFKYYFPPQGAAPAIRGSLQGFPYLPYYIQWKELMAELSPRNANSVRRQLWPVFLKLQWLPHATSDKLWNTSQRTERGNQTWWYRLPRQNDTGPCPQIVINPNRSKEDTLHIITLGVEPDFAAQAADDHDDEDEEEGTHPLAFDYDDQDNMRIYEERGDEMDDGEPEEEQEEDDDD